MKNLLLLFLFILAFKGYAQVPSISPYYPGIGYSNEYRRDLDQISYYDLNYTLNNLQNWIGKNMRMAVEKDEYKLNDKGQGIITYTFLDQASSEGQLQRMYFDFKVFPIGHEFVVESVTIRGFYNRLISFYAGYWNTRLNIDQAVTQKIVTTQNVQDKVIFHLKSSKPYITIQNTTIKDNAKFISEFKERKEKHESGRLVSNNEITEKIPVKEVDTSLLKIQEASKKMADSIDQANRKRLAEKDEYIRQYIARKKAGN